MTPRLERLLALLLIAAFGLAGWKMVVREATLPLAFASGHPALLALAASSATATTPALVVSPDKSFQFNAGFVSSVPGKAVHAASIVELRDGGLRAVWFSGSREGSGDVTIQTAVMDARTLRWSDESLLFDRIHVQQGLWRYVKKLGNPVIARAPDGSLSLWMVNVSLGGWAGSSISWARSTDEGMSWSRPRRLVTSPFVNISTLVKGAPFAYEDGSVGLPVYHEFLTKVGEILRITPQGQVVDKSRLPGSQASLQPVVLVQDSTHASVYLRSANAKALMGANTSDAGRTWSTTQGTSWPNPDSALAGIVTAADEQWLALNPRPKDREVLALLAAGKGRSLDDARLWVVESAVKPGRRLSLNDYEILLGDELKRRGVSDEQVRIYVASAKRQLCGVETCSQEFSYPYLLQTRDGYIHLVYTWHRTRIKHVRLDPLQGMP